jgi:chromosome segregation ATPase
VHTERNALAEYSRNLEEQHGAVTAHLDEALRQLHTVHAERNTLAGRLESVEAGYATLAARFDEAQRQRDALATRLDEATAECHRLAGTLQAIHASRSWRLVMGLRRLVSGFR